MLWHLLLGLFLFWSTFFCSLSGWPLLTTAKTCASLIPHCSTCSLLCFCFKKACHYPFVLPIVPQLNRVHLECNCTTITFLQSSSLHTVNARCSIISLAHGYVYKSLEGENSDSFFERIPSLYYKWINTVCRTNFSIVELERSIKR